MQLAVLSQSSIEAAVSLPISNDASAGLTPDVRSKVSSVFGGMVSLAPAVDWSGSSGSLAAIGMTHTAATTTINACQVSFRLIGCSPGWDLNSYQNWNLDLELSPSAGDPTGAEFASQITTRRDRAVRAAWLRRPMRSPFQSLFQSQHRWLPAWDRRVKR